MDRLEKFTEPARKVLTLAQDEAQRFHHNYIGTEHILLGLIRENDGVAARALSGLGYDLNNVRSAVESTIGRGDSLLVGNMMLAPRVKRVLELAVNEARQLKSDRVDTEHLLLGIVSEGEGIAAGILMQGGRSLSTVRQRVIDTLGHRSDNGN